MVLLLHVDRPTLAAQLSQTRLCWLLPQLHFFSTRRNAFEQAKSASSLFLIAVTTFSHRCDHQVSTACWAQAREQPRESAQGLDSNRCMGTHCHQDLQAAPQQ